MRTARALGITVPPSLASADEVIEQVHDYFNNSRNIFAISTRGGKVGLDHLGVQVEDQVELQDVYGRLRNAGGPVVEQGATTCCHAKSEKSWIDDPAGISWETFLTSGESTSYGDSFDRDARIAHQKACCAPQPAVMPKTTSACCSD
jgi:hypothetical protein